MSKDSCIQLAPFDPKDIKSDKNWLPLCSPQDRLSYSTAKGVYDTAMVTADRAVAAATVTYNQAVAAAKNAFDTAKTAAVAAGESLDNAVLVANTKKDAISGAPNLVACDVCVDPSLVTAQAAAVTAAAAAFTTASAAVTAAQAAYAAALTVLSTLAESVDPTKPGDAEPSEDATDIANATRDIAVATATAARDKAENVFNAVRFGLWTKLADEG
ncbi:MAG TPA: hypothetical protein VIA98_04885 [Allosphingosinicella sp.]|jgi:hypothetical protein